MSVEIKVANIEPIRPTFNRTARRFGTARPANRYQEASFDLQPMENFHYRPIWDPARNIYDASRTAITLQDWDAFKDPRQFYYATYVINRARMQENAEKNFDFIEKNQLLSALGAQRITDIETNLLPLRHAEWAANLNNCFITAYCFSSSMAQGAMYKTTDHLGIAQYISRIGLLLDSNSGTSLERSKELWLHDSCWQPLRKLTEDLLVEKDWFKVFVAQNLVNDSLINPTFYQRFQASPDEPSLAFMAMLTEFMLNWWGDISKWVDACIKVAVSDSDNNRALIDSWADAYLGRTTDALTPIVARFADGNGEQRLQDAVAALEARLKKLNVRTA